MAGKIWRHAPALLLAFYLLVGCNSNSRTLISADDVALSPLKVAPQQLDLGTLWRGSTVTHSFQISNTSSHPITIAEFKRACTCVSVTPETLVIPARGDAACTAIIQVPSESQYENDASFEAKVLPVIDDNHWQSAIWVFRGTTKPLLSFSDPIVHLVPPSDATRQEVADMVRCVEISTSTPLASLSAAYKGSPVVLSIEKRSPTHYLLSIRPPTSESVHAPYRSETLLHSTLPNGETIVLAGPSVDGVLYREAIAEPSFLNLGFVEHGSIAKEEIVVRTTRDSRYEISEYSIDASSAALTLERIDNHKHRLVLRMSTNESGTAQAQIAIKLTAPGKPTLQLLVPVHYYGVRRAG